MSSGLPEVLCRDDVLRYYSADDRGLIDCPGIFYGRPIWLPYFWHLACDGIGDQIQEMHEDGSFTTKTTIKIEEEERQDFPELGVAAEVVVWSDCGWIHGRTSGDRLTEPAALADALKTKSFVNFDDPFFLDIDPFKKKSFAFEDFYGKLKLKS